RLVLVDDDLLDLVPRSLLEVRRLVLSDPADVVDHPDRVARGAARTGAHRLRRSREKGRARRDARRACQRALQELPPALLTPPHLVADEDADRIVLVLLVCHLFPFPIVERTPNAGG